MVCTDKKMAQRVAFFGMKKMLTAGTYTLEQGSREGAWWVLSPTAEYLVYLPTKTRRAHCDCPFFADNAEFGVCKHLYFIQNHLKEQEKAQEEDGYHLRYTDGEGPEGCYPHPHVPGLGV